MNFLKMHGLSLTLFAFAAVVVSTSFSRAMSDGFSTEALIELEIGILLCILFAAGGAAALAAETDREAKSETESSSRG